MAPYCMGVLGLTFIGFEVFVDYIMYENNITIFGCCVTRNDDDGETNALAPLALATTTITVIGAYTRSPRNETALYEQTQRYYYIRGILCWGCGGARTITTTECTGRQTVSIVFITCAATGKQMIKSKVIKITPPPPFHTLLAIVPVMVL